MSARIYRFPTPEADIWPPRDYASPYSSREEQERIARVAADSRRDVFVMRCQAWGKAFGILAFFAVLFVVSFQIGRIY